MSEIFDIVDINDKVIGQATRSQVHGNPDLIHRVVHVLVFNSSGDLYLQKRGLNKDVQPGKWDTSVGGHLNTGETYLIGAIREMAEELGIANSPLAYLYKYLHTNDTETELVSTYQTTWDGPITCQEEEIDDGRFWKLAEIESNLSADFFTPNFKEEFVRYKQHTCRSAASAPR